MLTIDIFKKYKRNTSIEFLLKEPCSAKQSNEQMILAEG